MKVLVTGADGMVGTAIKKIFPKDSLICTDKKELDVTKIDNVMAFSDPIIDTILHLAAETDLETCESKVKQAYMTNTIGTANMVELAKHLKIPIIYISTAGVFDGKKKDAYDVTDIPNPVNHYGRSKYFGEWAVDSYIQHYILRAGWMMGGGPDIDKKFVNKIFKKIQKGENTIKVCNDIVGSPTYTEDLANLILKLIQKKKVPFGLYHCTGYGSPSRFDVACKIVELLDVKVKIVPVKNKDVLSEFSCPRSHNEVLINNINIRMRYWEDSLKEYIYGYFKS